MPTVSTVLHYAAPLTPDAPDDDWCIDALTRPPEVVLNFRTVPHHTTVTDLRDSAERPTLDTAGFERVTAPTSAGQRALAHNRAPALERYRQETAELLTSVTGADAVEFFDATLRRQDAAPTGTTPHQAPHQRVHVDQSPSSARARAALHGAGRRFSRFQIINVWRPLLEPVRNYPLALCDFRSLDLTADLVATRLEFPPWLKDRENYSVKHNPRHRWHYWRSLAPDEALLFKIYDSASRSLALAADGVKHPGPADVAGLCPHTAFYDEKGPGTGHLRTSLELRAVLFYD